MASVDGVCVDVVLFLFCFNFRCSHIIIQNNPVVERLLSENKCLLDDLEHLSPCETVPKTQNAMNKQISV